jgi:hypothetical protein
VREAGLSEEVLSGADRVLAEAISYIRPRDQRLTVRAEHFRLDWTLMMITSSAHWCQLLSSIRPVRLLHMITNETVQKTVSVRTSNDLEAENRDERKSLV